MNPDRWDVLSSWHNAWLVADSDERERLRAELSASHPDLAREANRLLAAPPTLPGFLETPAFVLAAHDLARDESTLAPGTMIGIYCIVDLVARGGMGDVYRAHDVRLERDVALKILAQTGPNDPQRVDRFLTEARVTASLDHPNIVRVYDVGLLDQRPYLVAELLEGETLRARISRGPVPPPECRRIAQEVAEGLIAAHAMGLVHRDLKPENIFLTRSGVTKILDFGIAKLAAEPGVRATLSTMTGMVLGTAGYLAPEQVRGDAVDSRADLFTLGSILFEMLTGHRAFARQHTIDTMYAIVHESPADSLDRLEVPPALADIVMRLLEKAPDARFQSAADLAWALEHADGSPRVRRNQRWGWYAGAATILLAAAAGLWSRGFVSRQARIEGITRFTWTAKADLDSAPVVSPDGQSIAFTGRDSTGTRLFIRALSSLEPVVVADSAGAKQPFWSPDGKSVGFFAQGKLMKVTLGGTPEVICAAPDPTGGAWSRSNTIVFAPSLINAGLSRVSANGGKVEPATLLDVDRGENSHRWPVFLPDAVHFLYFVRSTNDERRGVYVGSLDRPAATPGEPLFLSESEALYAPVTGNEGVLLYEANGAIGARRFNPATPTLIGDARMLSIPVAGNTGHHSALLGASADVLAAVGSPILDGVHLNSIGRTGADHRLWPERELQNWPRVSPDGRWLARQRIDARGGNPDIWVEDLTRGTRLRVTTAPGSDLLPVWSPDSRRIAYLSLGIGREPTMHIAAADGTGVLQDIPCPAAYCEPTDWDGRKLVITVPTARGMDIWTVSTERIGTAHPLLTAPFVERDGRLSPDGKWLAFVSEESGRPEVSVRSLSTPARRIVVSSGGASQPVWRRDGGELFYVDSQGRLVATAVRHPSPDTLAFGDASPLNIPPIGTGHFGTQYDVSPDGRRIYFLDSGDEHGPREIGFVLGWRGLLK